MSTKKDFFKEKKIWSKVKDELLGCYLKPYFSKVLHTSKPIVYVDCFAGKGKFDDGFPGSPLIALKCLSDCLAQSYLPSSRSDVRMQFIDLNYAHDLRQNLEGQTPEVYSVIDGKFEEEIIKLLTEEHTKNPSINLFLYVDPYGVKALDTSLFDKLPNMFSTAELLINLNSFGFFREACRVMNVAITERDIIMLDDLEEFESSHFDSMGELDVVAGGDYWRNIVAAYNKKEIDGYQAEQEFSRLYKERLRDKYKYVLSMPIQLKPTNHPKYRMVFATNHPEGCLLMADNIAKRTDRLIIEIQDRGQRSIFPKTISNEIVEESLLEVKVLEQLSRTTSWTPLTTFLADFYNQYGVLCPSSKLSSGRGGSILKTLEKNGRVDVLREPCCSDNGRPYLFWSEGRQKKQRLWLRNK
ncbi:MAG: three-Cys-motif partner protein TcmP [Anaerolineaceae bacterium]